jgi:hypothetical protein
MNVEAKRESAAVCRKKLGNSGLFCPQNPATFGRSHHNNHNNHNHTIIAKVTWTNRIDKDEGHWHD